MSEETNIIKPAAELADAEKLIESSKWEEALQCIKSYWLEHPTDRQAIELMSKLLSKLNRSKSAEELSKLASCENEIEKNPTALFHASFALINEQQYELAVMLLKLCHKLASDQAIVSYEIGFSLMCLKKYEEAIQYLEEAHAKEIDFDTLINLAVCHTHLRDSDKAKSYLEQTNKFSLSDDQKKELVNQQTIVERLISFTDKKQLSARDWLFIKYGSLLLIESDSSSGTFSAIWNDYEKTAHTLLIFSKTIKALKLEYEVVEFYNTLSRPLAQALAQMLDIKAESYEGPSRQNRALLVMAWASDIIGPHENFTAQDGKRSIFAYGLTSLESLPITPELVGYISESCAMPWDEHWKVEEYTDGRSPNVIHVPADDSDPVLIVEKIMQAAHNQEKDSSIDPLVKVLTDYYRNNKDLMLLNNSDKFPNRPEYFAEISW